MFLSATIITHNEERNIERCLNSLIGVVDEIVVVDSNSTDATAEICRRYGCEPVLRSFTGYGSQRQYAASLARGQYVLSIDADEVLTPELRQTIIDLKERGFDHRMYAFEVATYICGRPVRRCGMAPQWEVRLFDKRYAMWDMLDIGERISHGGSVLPCRMPGQIHHLRSNTFEELEFKELRNARLKGRVLAAAGVNASLPACWLRATMALMKSHLQNGAFLDGETGRRIAMTQFRATLTAYLTAREISRNKK